MIRSSWFVAFLVVGLASFEARAEAPQSPPEPFRMKAAVQAIDGWFNTFSRPGVGTFTFDMAALTAAKEHGKIDFVRSGDGEAWYFPYQGGFRVEKQVFDADGWRTLRLVNEDRSHRTTITLGRYGPKENFEWRGFFVFEETDGPILGTFSFTNTGR